ncbi:hypothetical protein CYY_010054 [Polysphondylium violaceum]|uniref:Uncharacterized protein n=1 Tax=Polysphondylium violaceum TaxID=133409 RepID=A0A8J4PSH0_9MYCE|nr:hypothetical protein CYY_010054 [Polysphondylium violaceum]
MGVSNQLISLSLVLFLIFYFKIVVVSSLRAEASRNANDNDFYAVNGNCTSIYTVYVYDLTSPNLGIAFDPQILSGYNLAPAYNGTGAYFQLYITSQSTQTEYQMRIDSNLDFTLLSIPITCQIMPLPVFREIGLVNPMYAGMFNVYFFQVENKILRAQFSTYTVSSIYWEMGLVSLDQITFRLELSPSFTRTGPENLTIGINYENDHTTQIELFLPFNENPDKITNVQYSPKTPTLSDKFAVIQF